MCVLPPPQQLVAIMLQVLNCVGRVCLSVCLNIYLSLLAAFWWAGSLFGRVCTITWVSFWMPRYFLPVQSSAFSLSLSIPEEIKLSSCSRRCRPFVPDTRPETVSVFQHKSVIWSISLISNAFIFTWQRPMVADIHWSIVWHAELRDNRGRKWHVTTHLVQ